MKKNIYALSLIIALTFAQQTLLGHSGAFTFDVAQKNEHVSGLEIDTYSEDENFYDAECDRSVVAKPSLYKRMITRFYAFWHSQSGRIKYFAHERYRKLSHHTYAFFKAFFNRIKQVRNRTS